MKNATIFEALREDHDEQRALLDQLVATEGDSPERQDLFTRAKSALQSHAASEERYFYVPLMASDTTQDKARHSVSEHEEIDSLIEDLEEIDYSSPGWLAAARKLHETVNHHLDEEEHEVFQLAGGVLKKSHQRELADQYRKDMNSRQ